MIVGDDGGISDYIFWHSNLDGITSNLFVIEDKTGKFSKTKFRKEIESKKEEYIVKYGQLNSHFDIDDDPNFNLEKVDEIIQDIMDRTGNNGVSLYIARKKVLLKSDYFQELKMKKFLLLNLILAFSTLAKDGNLVIKIYDMFTPFTVSILYILFNYFENMAVVKPFSMRPHSAV